MRKEIIDSKISFYNEEDEEIMYMDFSADEFIWFFLKNEPISITKDDELFEYIDYIMNEKYIFGIDHLQSKKSKDQLIWYSDCYYNPSDIMSVKAVSSLIINRINDKFIIHCKKPIYDIINKNNKTFCICFSPAGNGKYSKNIVSNLSLQDDFALNVYQKLMTNKLKVKEKREKNDNPSNR